MKGKELLINAALFLVSASLLVVGVEVAYRLKTKTTYPFPQGIVENHPLLGYRLKPDARGTVTTPEYTIEYAINSHGLRDVERTYEKTSGTFRIVAIGDSFALGEGVSYEDMYLTRLERSLVASHPGRPVEVIKAGIGGYDPVQETVFLKEEGLRYAPDIVLLSLYENDFTANTEVPPGPYVQDGYLVSPPSDTFTFRDFVFRHLRSWGFIAAKIRAIPFLAQKNAAAGTIHFEVDSTQAHPKNPETVRVKEHTFDLLAGMQDISRAAGAEFVVVAIPASFRLDLEWRKRLDAQYGLLPEETDYLRLYRDLERYGAERGFGVLNLGDMLLARFTEGTPLYYPSDQHFTKQGSALVAEELSRYLEANGYIPD